MGIGNMKSMKRIYLWFLTATLLTVTAGSMTSCMKTPKTAEEFLDRGIKYGQKGNYDRAIADYNEAIRLDPNFAKLYNNRGVAYAYKRDYDRAITDFNEAIRLDPDFVDVYNNRGGMYYDMKDYDRAIADYTEVIRLDPNNTDAYDNMNKVLVKKVAEKMLGELE